MEETLPQLTNINFINGVIAFAGMALFFIMRYKNRKNKKIGFHLAFWLNDNLLELVISLVTTTICFLMLDDLSVYFKNFFPESLPLVKITAFLCGFANQWLLKLITSPFKKKI